MEGKEAANQPLLYWIEWNTSLSQWLSLTVITSWLKPVFHSYFKFKYLYMTVKK